MKYRKKKKHLRGPFLNIDMENRKLIYSRDKKSRRLFSSGTLQFAEQVWDVLCQKFECSRDDVKTALRFQRKAFPGRPHVFSDMKYFFGVIMYCVKKLPQSQTRYFLRHREHAVLSLQAKEHREKMENTSAFGEYRAEFQSLISSIDTKPFTHVRSSARYGRRKTSIHVQICLYPRTMQTTEPTMLNSPVPMQHPSENQMFWIHVGTYAQQQCLKRA